ncbi:c-type cytochrome [Oleiagrimonas soli]|uniref:Cytochrome c-551 n=1 Tax=Oleiagrimonas soli TaxID=1543381 RepID=A0A841KRL5_9GAMM|nr:c-type cytochrome [Oleiagrimonas soli]MBB6184594.1 cytochrome c [Oleiagrimonas soli]
MHVPFSSKRVLAALVLVFGFGSALALQAADTKVPEGEAKARASDCFSCHAVDHKLVGPAYTDVAKRYAGQGDAAVTKLVKKIKAGGAGDWGDIPMTPHPNLSDADLTVMVHWILSLNGQKTETAQAGGSKTYTYKTEDGKRVKTDFAVFTGPDQKHVTKAVFHGYEQYNSYCFRCHGGDAVGGEYAPDLRKSLEGGMTWQQFLSTAMAGRQAKGMPSWAGFFEEKDIRAIYDYVKARQLDLVPVGRPPSDQD